MRKTFTRRFLPGVLLAAALCGAVLPGIAFAQQPPSATDLAQARELLNQGFKLRDQGDAPGALEKFRAAHALAETPISATELGRAYLAVGKLVDARETFLSVARIPHRSVETARSAAARAESAKLADQVRPRIPSVTIKVIGAPIDSVVVSIDGVEVPSAALTSPRLIDPGAHEVSAKGTNGGTAKARVELAEGETRDVDLRIEAMSSSERASGAAAVTSDPNPPASHDTMQSPSGLMAIGADRREGEATARRSHVLEWSLVGVGAAIGVAGLVLMGIEANGASAAINDRNRGAYDSASTLWTVGLVGAIAGAAAGAGGVIVYATSAGSSRVSASSTSTWLGLSRNGVRLGVTW